MSSSSLELRGTKQEEFLATRQIRIKEEDARLSKSKNQRKRATLDYIRRGRLKDGVEILPSVIDLTPLLLEGNEVDFEAPDFDIERCCKSLIEECLQFEKYLAEEDALIRTFLQGFGVKPKENGGVFVDREWYAKIIDAFATYKKPRDAKNPQSEVDFEITKRKKLQSKIATIVDGDPASLIEGYESSTISFPERDISSSIRKFLFEKRPQEGFRRTPKLSEYKGPKLEEPPSFLDKEPRPDLDFVPRDKIPTFKGGIILDGNFGFDDSRNPLRPKDKLIIDHHDKFNTSTRDTATTMAFGFLEDPKQMALLEDPLYQDENGVINVVTNNIDADSILSTWVFYNRQNLLELRKKDPKRYSSLKNILCKVTEAGDFLLGSNIMEYGATSRDYEYVMRHYLDACRQQIKDGRRIKLTKILEDQERQQAELRARLVEIDQAILERNQDSDVSEKIREIENVKNGLTPNGVPLEKGAQSSELKRLNQELSNLLGELADIKKGLKAELQTLEKETALTRKNIEKAQTQPMTHAENRLLLDHMHDTVLDIIENPFKYQKFMQQGRDTENAVMAQMDAAYREGSVEITQDTRDEDILTIRPLKSETLPENESHDGEYFYYRGREDFNRELIVKFEGQFFMMAINTQNMKGLQKYNFDELIDIFRSKEAEAIRKLVEEKQIEFESLTGPNDQKRRAELQRELETLRIDGVKNDKGQIWRSRTQMVFAFKSYIPEAEIMEEIYVWKEAQSRPERVKGLTREMTALFPGKNLEPVRLRVSESFSVPQLGKHHNEGMLMDTHLQLMIQTLQDIESGNFPQGTSLEIQAILRETVVGNMESLKKYIFLHDIAKVDTLRITYSDGRVEEPSMDKWLAMTSSETRENPVLLQKFLTEQGMRSISYYHADTEAKAHGDEGKKYLEQFGEALGVPSHLLIAISLHEIAYQFTKTNVDLYNKFFLDLSPNEISWVMTASYLDTMASRGPDGKPDLSNFVALANSIHNGQILKQVEEIVAEKRADLDPKKVAQAIRSLKASESPFIKPSSEIATNLVEECLWDKYEKIKLSLILDALVMAGNITQSQKSELMDAVKEDGLVDELAMKQIRSKLGQANVLVNEAFKSSRV